MVNRGDPAGTESGRSTGHKERGWPSQRSVWSLQASSPEHLGTVPRHGLGAAGIRRPGAGAASRRSGTAARVFGSFEWVAEGAAVCVCGSLQSMAAGLHQAWTEIPGTEALEPLSDAARYRRDVH